ncbi:glutamine amidotransferase [Meridianimarinicoccus roseus]|uniref:Glutamine amidotransferase n=1 Tax=Meridianimarinicoccus roseus TaxID=2072018 RepID=A0A2V2LGN4_9RHOB|nr:glutamine amidotransferase family protein [Meridianimarinicoccus roseus]PWR02664.1 glutamine amidotransferase [Meridianimarinicoccus roseus]
MCGIVGLFLKDSRLEPELGAMLTAMLVTMTDRGPDSAGIAIYNADAEKPFKITVQSPEGDTEFGTLADRVAALTGAPARLERKGSHAVLALGRDRAKAVLAMIRSDFPGLRIMSQGNRIEIFKETGLPQSVAEAFGVAAMRGTHGIGHTRMATESAVTTLGAHPFSTGPDQCLVHNGSLSNHNSLRRQLVRDGMRFETENDSEVAAAYLTHRLQEGRDLGGALRDGLADLDGFYTFVVGTETGFGVLRDPIACKPAVMAETDRYVAFGSEYRALVDLPGIREARVWEPQPAEVYFWERAA